MNPKHLLIISLITLVSWMLGYITDKDTPYKFWPNGLSILIVLTLLMIAVVNFCKIVILTFELQ